MDAVRRHAPHVELMEPRVPLGGATAAPAPSVARPQLFDGAIVGRFHGPGSNPATAAECELSGSGYVRGLGQVSARGSVQARRGGLPGPVQGTLTLSGPRGSITLALRSTPSRPGPRPDPEADVEAFFFRVQRGTGAYRHMSGGGTMVLTRTGLAASQAFGREAGPFTLVFR